MMLLSVSEVGCLWSIWAGRQVYVQQIGSASADYSLEAQLLSEGQLQRRGSYAEFKQFNATGGMRRRREKRCNRLCDTGMVVQVNLVATQLVLDREHPNRVVFSPSRGLDPLLDLRLRGAQVTDSPGTCHTLRNMRTLTESPFHHCEIVPDCEGA